MAGYSYSLDTESGSSHSVTSSKHHNDDGFVSHIAGQIRSVMSDEDLRTLAYGGSVIGSVFTIVNGVRQNLALSRIQEIEKELKEVLEALKKRR